MNVFSTECLYFGPEVEAKLREVDDVLNKFWALKDKPEGKDMAFKPEDATYFSPISFDNFIERKRLERRQRLWYAKRSEAYERGADDVEPALVIERNADDVDRVERTML